MALQKLTFDEVCNLPVGSLIKSRHHEAVYRLDRFYKKGWNGAHWDVTQVADTQGHPVDSDGDGYMTVVQIGLNGLLVTDEVQ